jgi:hypothetical protein
MNVDTDIWILLIWTRICGYYEYGNKCGHVHGHGTDMDANINCVHIHVRVDIEATYDCVHVHDHNNIQLSATYFLLCQRIYFNYLGILP